jgi:hypothetical protein
MPIGKQESTLAFYGEKEMYRKEQNGTACQTYCPMSGKKNTTQLHITLEN